MKETTKKKGKLLSIGLPLLIALLIASGVNNFFKESNESEILFHKNSLSATVAGISKYEAEVATLSKTSAEGIEAARQLKNQKDIKAYSERGIAEHEHNIVQLYVVLGVFVIVFAISLLITTRRKSNLVD